MGCVIVVMAPCAAPRVAGAHGEACSSVQGNDTCPQGEACSSQDGSTGVCTSPPCSSDLECVSPLVWCDTGRTPAVCIQCRRDSECAPGRRCELDPRSALSNLCVECTPGQGTCEAAAAGHRCLFSKGICGCAMDGDCAAGRACGADARCEAPGMSVTDAGPGDGAARDAAPVRPAATSAPSVPLAAGGAGCTSAPTRARAGGSSSSLVSAHGARWRSPPRARCDPSRPPPPFGGRVVRPIDA